MKVSEQEKLKAAYALNLWTVSISQIVDYNDVNVMEQEYDTIMNNLNLENMPKDEALLEVIKEIMDEITSMRMDEGDRQIVEKKYQRQVKNAIWSAVPNVGAIFSTSNPLATGITLATQIGIGYMNYRRNKAEYEMEFERAKWEIQKNRMMHLNGLQKQLFETAWRLADVYEFPDEYRLTARQITNYNQALMEMNPVKRYNRLEAMKPLFQAYPAFWYQIGSTANCIYRSKLYESDFEIQAMYKAFALECFKKYHELNHFNLLRNDVLTSSWALEYMELLDLNAENEEAKELINLAEKFSGYASDVLELCAFAYLRINDQKNAIRLFHYLVNKDYNVIVNTQILSGLYIKEMRSDDSGRAADARRGYRQLSSITNPQYILEVPPDDVDLDNWKPSWNKEEDFEEFIEKQLEAGQEKEYGNQAKETLRLDEELENQTRVENSRKRLQEDEEMEKKARVIVVGAAAAAGAAGVIPVPLADMPMMIGDQVAMLASICAVYKVDIARDGLKTLVLGCFGVGGAAMIGKTIATSLLKALPFANIVGMTVSAGTGAAVTTALGFAFIEVCKAYRRGELNESDITSEKGLDYMKYTFKKQMDEKKNKNN